MKTFAAPQPSALIQPFYPALDGLRAVAFLMVFIVHYRMFWGNTSILEWGWVGVDIFFVLSGFLITGILFDSLHRNDFFKTFYIRRALRIFPLYYGFWLAVLLTAPLTHCIPNRFALTWLLYIGNFFQAGGAIGLHAEPAILWFGHPFVQNESHILNLVHLWSLCVEEQFYLLWPGVIWLVRSRKALLRVCLAAMLLAPIARTAYLHAFPHMALSGGALYFSSWARIDTLLAGAAIALWLRSTSPLSPVSLSPVTLRRAATAAACLAPAVFLLYAALHPFAYILVFDPFVDTIGFSLVAISAGGVLLLAIDPHTRLYRALQIRPLPALGRISYGLYFFHLLPINLFLNRVSFAQRHHIAFLIPAVAFVCTVVAAQLSFKYLESPFLRLKRRLTGDRRQHPSPAPLGFTPNHTQGMQR